MFKALHTFLFKQLNTDYTSYANLHLRFLCWDIFNTTVKKKKSGGTHKFRNAYQHFRIL